MSINAEIKLIYCTSIKQQERSYFLFERKFRKSFINLLNIVIGNGWKI